MIVDKLNTIQLVRTDRGQFGHSKIIIVKLRVTS